MFNQEHIMMQSIKHLQPTKLVNTSREALIRPMLIIQGIVERRRLAHGIHPADALSSKSRNTMASAPQASEGAISEASAAAPGSESGSGDDGGGDGDGDPDSDRRRCSCSTRSSSPLSLPSASVSPPVPLPNKLSALPGEPCCDWSSLFHFLNTRRAQWMAFSLTVMAFLLAVWFSHCDKDVLAALMLTEPIAIILIGFLGHRRTHGPKSS